MSAHTLHLARFDEYARKKMKWSFKRARAPLRPGSVDKTLLSENSGY